MNNNNNPEKKEKKVALDESPVPHINKGVAIAAICLFMAVILLPSVVWGSFLAVERFVPGTMASLNLNPPTTEFDKHYVQFPEKFDIKTFPTEFEAWFNDNLPFRSHLFNSNEKIMSNLEKPYEEKWRDVLITMFQDNKQSGGSATVGGENTETFMDYLDNTETEEITTETETLPTYENDTSETETMPIYVDTEDTEEETLPPALGNPDDETTELPTVETEEETVPEYTDNVENPGDETCEHNYTVIEEIAPSCTEYGVNRYTCSNCERVYREYTAMKHNYGEAVVLKEPTCSEFGEKGLRCADCGKTKIQEYLHKADHIFGEAVVEVPATCSEWGINLFTCTVCSGEKREYVAKTDHQCSEEFSIIQEATCSEYGLQGRKCANCDYYADKQYTAKAAHSYGEFTLETPPTCGEYGVQVQVCSICKTENREYVQKLGHNYVSSVPERPLCGTRYTETLTCTNCNDTSTNEKVATHELGKKLKVVQATTETYGYTLVRCKHCDGTFRTEIKGRLTDTSSFLTISRSSQVNEGKFRWLFYLGDNSKAYYDGTNALSDEQMATNAAILDQLNELCKAKGITLQIAIWPNKDQVYAEFTGYENATLEGRKNTRTYKWVKYVKDNTDVKIVYPLEELWAAKPYFDVYCKYDTHWNTAGGFIGYQAMLESIGLESVRIHDCPVFEYEGGAPLASDHYYTQIRGDMMGMGGWSYNAADYPAHRNYYVKYHPDVTTRFLNGTDGKNGAGDIRHTVSDNATYDKKFVMLADSFRVMQLGYLEKDFSDCYLCHRNQVNTDYTKASIKALGEGDILVIAAVERYDQDTVNTAQQIINILSSQ